MRKQTFWRDSNKLQIFVDRVFNFYLFKHICLYLSHFFVVEKVLRIEIWEAFASSSGLCGVSHSPVLTSFPLPGLEWGSGWHLSITLGSGGRPLGSKAEAPWEAPIPRQFHRGPSRQIVRYVCKDAQFVLWWEPVQRPPQTSSTLAAHHVLRPVKYQLALSPSSPCNHLCLELRALLSGQSLPGCKVPLSLLPCVLEITISMKM